MKSLSEMIEPRQEVISLIPVRALPYGNMSFIDNDNEDDWELAVKSGIMNFSVSYKEDEAIALCEVMREGETREVCEVTQYGTYRGPCSEDKVHRDMMNVIRNIAKSRGCEAVVRDGRNPESAWLMFDYFDERQRQLYIDFKKHVEN